MDGQNWIGIKWIAFGYIWKRRPTFLSNLYQFISKCHSHSWKIILSCYVAVILQMKDFCSANLTFRAHNYQNQTKLPKTAWPSPFNISPPLQIGKLAKYFIISDITRRNDSIAITDVNYSCVLFGIIHFIIAVKIIKGKGSFFLFLSLSLAVQYFVLATIDPWNVRQVIYSQLDQL